MHPVTQHLPIHPADVGGVAAAHALQHGGKREDATALGRGDIFYFSQIMMLARVTKPKKLAASLS